MTAIEKHVKKFLEIIEEIGSGGTFCHRKGIANIPHIHSRLRLFVCGHPLWILGNLRL
jgi:hypothetical protein